MNTIAILDEVVEGVAVAGVGELVVAGGELLEALGGDGGEIAGELGVLCQDHATPRNEAIDQRLLPHPLPGSYSGGGDVGDGVREQKKNKEITGGAKMEATTTVLFIFTFLFSVSSRLCGPNISTCY